MRQQVHNELATVSSIKPAPALIQYALRGLKSCWMPEMGRWSHLFHLDGRANPNQSVPSSDVFYSLNVLLGLSKVGRYGKIHEFDIPTTFTKCAAELLKHKTPKYGYGTALWASSELGLDLPPATLHAITAMIENRTTWKQFRAQDLGMILTGCVRRAEREPGAMWTTMAHSLFAFLADRFSCPSGLFYDAPEGGRRNFSSFATHTYLTLACFAYGEWSGDERALNLAKNCTARLIELQGPQGEWPWFFYTPGGRVVDFYEIYSVHQEGMAPAILAHAERHGVPGASEALIRGFEWILGHNQLNRSMLWKKEGLISRSQIRKGELNNKYKRAARAIGNAITGRSARLIDPSDLRLRLECRSYELGWILYSFGQRSDLSELQDHPQFAA
jgi:hypothetical protein